MVRSTMLGAVLCAAAFTQAAFTPAAWAAPQGVYLEARTCQVYTGPCFANAEVGLAGREAIMAWSIKSGSFNDVDLAGLKAVLVVSSGDTLGFRGLAEQTELRALLLLDAHAAPRQQEALAAFVKQAAGKAGDHVVRMETAPIQMSLDLEHLSGALQAGKQVKLTTRKAREGDCICSNEAAYYPPLAELTHFVPGVTLEGDFTGRGLGVRWSIPDSRSAYMGLFGE